MDRPPRPWILPLSAALLACALGAARAAETPEPDWPFWRGPGRDGISPETAWSHEPLRSRPEVLWTRELGDGHAAVAIAGDRLFTMGRDGERDVVYCLHPATGKEQWTFSYECPAGNYPGPRSTPVVDGERLYTLSREGHLHCLDAATGRVRWRINVQEACGARPPKWGFASSAVVEGPLVIINAGTHGMAFDKKTGRAAWISGAGVSGYATPVVSGGGRSLALFGSDAAYGVDLRSGRKLWSYPWVTRHDVNAADPVASAGRVFLTSGYGKGCVLLDVSRGRPKVVWRNEGIRSHFGSTVLVDGYLYGADGNAGRRDAGLKCLDLATGREMWSGATGFCSLIAAGERLLVLNERGELIVARARPDAYQELARCRVLRPGRGGRCWTPPVLCRGRVYCRTTTGTLVCLDLRS